VEAVEPFLHAVPNCWPTHDSLAAESRFGFLSFIG